MSYQSTTIVGNPAADPKLETTKGGKKYAKVSVAVNEHWTGADGQKHEETTWYKCVFFNEKQAEIASKYIKQGKEVLLVGKVKSSGWIDKDGNAQSSLEFNVQNLTLLSNGGGGGNGNAGSGSGDGQHLASLDESDIPFN